MIYLASPYSDHSAQVRYTRFLAAQEYAAKQMEKGRLVFSPIAYGHQFAMKFGFSGSFEFWQDFAHTMIRASTKVVVLQLDGWDRSVGVQAEIKFAEQLCIPVEYEKAFL